MKVQIETKLPPDGHAQAPPYELERGAVLPLLDIIMDGIESELVNDAGRLIGPGATVTITVLEA